LHLVNFDQTALRTQKKWSILIILMLIRLHPTLFFNRQWQTGLVALTL
jgi:hypothetical protein